MMDKREKNFIDFIEAIVRWIEISGFKGDLSAISAGLYDIDESIKEIKRQMLPSLLKLKPHQYDEALGIVIDLLVELEHMKRHIDDAIKPLKKLADFLDKSTKSDKKG